MDPILGVLFVAMLVKYLFEDAYSTVKGTPNPRMDRRAARQKHRSKNRTWGAFTDWLGDVAEEAREDAKVKRQRSRDRKHREWEEEEERARQAREDEQARTVDGDWDDLDPVEVVEPEVVDDRGHPGYNPDPADPSVVDMATPPPRPAYDPDPADPGVIEVGTPPPRPAEVPNPEADVNKCAYPECPCGCGLPECPCNKPDYWKESDRDECSCDHGETGPRCTYCTVTDCETCEEMEDEPEQKHVDYPHEPGYLHDCPACESQCYCDHGKTQAPCVFCGDDHNCEICGPGLDDEDQAAASPGSPEKYWLTGQKSTTSGTNNHEGNTTMSDTVEVFGLDQAIAYAKAVAASHADHATAGNGENYVGHLQAGENSGAVIDSAAAAAEASGNAAAAWEEHAIELEKQKAVQEAYDHNPDAGSKQFQQGGR